MEILKAVFSMSIIGSILFFIFLLIKPLTKKNFSSSWHYKVSIIILLFFILPIGSFIKFPRISDGIIPRRSQVEIEEVHSSEVVDNAGDLNHISNTQDILQATKEDVQNNEIKHQEPNMAKDSKTAQYAKKDFNINFHRDVILYTWLIGMIALFLLKIMPYIKFKSAILESSTEVEDTEVLKLFTQCKYELNISNNISLRTYQYIGSPMLIGILNPMILIPDTDEDRKTLKMIFLHELNHYKRKDIIIKFLGFIVNIIHWFNPIVYLLLRDMDNYCECSIDEKVVNEMEIGDRKYYGETILKLIDRSNSRRYTLTTAMSSNGLELKSRLENMLFFKKNSRSKFIVSLFALYLILLSGLTIACSIMPVKAMEGNNSFVVYAKDDGLYFTYLNNGEEIKIHERYEGREFSYPIISRSGDYIAYTYNGDLYVFDFENENSDKLAGKVVSYDWIDNDTLIYSTEEKGFAIYNLKPKDKFPKKQMFIDNYYYENFKVSKIGTIYGNRISKWTIGSDEYGYNTGIVEIKSKENGEFTIITIIEGTKSTDEMIGYDPIIWDITEDGKYIYIMEKPASGSLSADGIGIGIYDVKNKTHTDFKNIGVLPYKDNLTINPKNNNLIGIIEGGAREMILNKEVVLIDVDKNKTYNTINFMDKDLVAMTPSFTLNGDKLLYSATKAVDNSQNFDYNEEFRKWEKRAHNIYEYDLKTSQVRKITEGDYFDFMPISISKDEILFSRYKGNGYYSLIKLTNGKEEILVDNIIFDYQNEGRAFGFYGHIKTEETMDIFLNEKKENTKTNNKKSQKPIAKKDEETKNLDMIKFSAISRSDEDIISFEDLKNIYNINSNYTIRDDWYVINEDYFQKELLGYDNAQKVDFYVLRLESNEGPILTFTDTDHTDGWKYTNDNISEIIDKHDKSLQGGFSYEPCFVIYTEVTLEDGNTIKTPKLAIYNE